MKIIKILYENGAIYGIPLEVIAKIRADYYVDKDPDTTYNEEFEFVMEDDYEGYEWLRNQMNREEYEQHLFQIKPPRAFDPVREMDDGLTEFRCGVEYEEQK
jgi:hypothetical protein